MHIKDLSGKNVCILGFGREGKAMLRAIEKYAPSAEVTIADSNEQTAVTGKHWLQVGTGYLHNLSKFDVIIKSPGIPPMPELDAVKDRITSGTQIFFDSIRDSGATVIGITGSKGKSTTSTLIYEILKAAGKDAHLIGNIGTPAIDFIDKAKPGTFFVQELSSYQLMDLQTSPHIAVVTSFFPEHLDYHGTLEAYWDAKAHIARFQTPSDVILYNAKSDGATKIGDESPGQKIPFSDDDSPVTLADTKLIGQHNLSNIAAAFKVAEYLKIPRDVALQVFRTFPGLPHRLQSLGVHQGIEWVDDAISTTPDSTIAALDALGDRVATIILGGQDRGVPYEHLGERITKSSVRTVILFPGSGPRIREAIGNAHADVCFHESATMEDAVEAAIKKTPEHAICLLSTASPSYGMFKNFEEKGDAFKRCIMR